MAAAILVPVIASVVAAAASAGVGLYSADQSAQATKAAATRQSNNIADNQLAANRAAETYRGQQEALRERQYSQVQTEQDRQAQLREEADAQFRQSANQSSIAAQLKKQKAIEGKLGADYAKSAETDINIPGVDTGAAAADEAGTRVVAGGYKDALKKVSAFLGNQAKGQAGLDAITGAGLMDSIQQGRNAGNLNRITNFMHGSANVLPAETGAINTARGLVDQTQAAHMGLFTGDQSRINDAAAIDISNAQHAGDTGMAISSLLGTVGNIGASYAGNALGTAKPKIIYDAAGNPVKTAPTTTKIT